MVKIDLFYLFASEETMFSFFIEQVTFNVLKHKKFLKKSGSDPMTL